MADVKHCIASPINDFEGFLHIFYCRIKNVTESLTEKLLRQVCWQGRVQNNLNSPNDVRSPNCRVLTQTYSPNFFLFSLLASWQAVVSFTDVYISILAKERKKNCVVLALAQICSILSKHLRPCLKVKRFLLSVRCMCIEMVNTINSIHT